MINRKEKTIDVKDAFILEDFEQVQLVNNRTRHAIHQTYNPKSPTKARRKLPNGRKWKDKSKQYAVLEGQMTARQFNAKTKAMHVLDKLYKQKFAARQKHSLVD